MKKFPVPQASLCIALFFSSTGFVAASPHDLSWTFGGFGTQSYRLDGVQPGDADRTEKNMLLNSFNGESQLNYHIHSNM